jgi:hypothetical protein
MMNSISSRLRKGQVHPHGQARVRSGAGRDGRAGVAGDEAGDCGHVPKPCAAATATIKSTNPMGTSHKRLNHLLDPILILGETP